MTNWLERALAPAQLNGLELRNRVIKAAAFEGMSTDGAPTEALSDCHLRIAEGGVGMTTIAYCAAESDGRVLPQMLYMDERIRPEMEKMIARIHSTGAAVSGQLSHCGNFTKIPQLHTKRPMGPSFKINTLGLTSGNLFAGTMTHADIDNRVNKFAEAAIFMKSVGFDAIEMHFGHGYGLHQFISPLSNKRNDEYGGPLINRMRMPLRALEAVRVAVGDDFPIITKITTDEGAKGGITIDEAEDVAALLDKGGADAIIPSAGVSGGNTGIMFRGDSMAKEIIKRTSNPVMKLGIRMMASRMFQELPYTDLYLLENAKRIRDRVECGVVYVGGCCGANDLATLMAEGFDFVQLGRALIYDPDFVKNAHADSGYRNGCIHCNKCAALIEAEGGVYCPEKSYKDPGEPGGPFRGTRDIPAADNTLP